MIFAGSFGDANAYQANERQRFERAWEDFASAAPLVDGGSIGEIRIPRLGLAAYVVQGDRRRSFDARSVTWPTPRCQATRGTSCLRVIATRSSGRCSGFASVTPSR
jgi:hypothetical protein